MCRMKIRKVAAVLLMIVIGYALIGGDNIATELGTSSASTKQAKQQAPNTRNMTCWTYRNR